MWRNRIRGHRARPSRPFNSEVADSDKEEVDQARLALIKLGACWALSLLTACGAQAQAPADPPPQASRPHADAEDQSHVPHEDRSRDRHEERRRPSQRSQNPTPERNQSQRNSVNTVSVTRVVDGDTIEVDYRGSTVDIRLIGIDTPETVHPSEPVECFGPAASRFTTTSLTGETVRLEFDVERRDHYGRMLAYVWDEGKLFNSKLVRRGLATVSTYPPNVKYVEHFTDVQSKAQGAGRGLWERCSAPLSDTSANGGGDDTSSTGKCNGYSPCLPPASDYDCEGGGGDGPQYAQGPIRVTGSDPYELDSEGDGIACES